MASTRNLYQLRSDENANISDFSAILQKQKKTNTKSLSGGKAVIAAPESYISATNRNLSSVLLEIQDDGPACKVAGKQAGVHDFSTKHDINETSRQQHSSEDADDVVSLSTSSFRQQEKHKFFLQSKENMGSWLHLLLLMIIVALLAFSLFRFETGSVTSEKTLLSNEDEFQHSVVSVSKISVTEADIINEKLAPLQINLQLIKKIEPVLTVEKLPLEENKLSEKINQEAVAQADDSIINDQSVSLLTELKPIKIEHKSSSQYIDSDHDLVVTQELSLKQINLKQPAEKATKQDVVEKSQFKNSSYSVALASFKNKNKAQQLSEKVKGENHSLIIKQAVVNGDRVYRLSAHGFMSRDEANVFVVNVANKYDLHDSWIRKAPLKDQGSKTTSGSNVQDKKIE